ncbi:MAG: acylphosphatase [Sedimentisphaerales bacterium]|nr:acylphosphatase [Sedimentisphaerales bacterium]
MIAKHIIFKGRVQGVGFRYTSYREAKRNQLTGWVRNLPDGTVEMLAQGQAKDIDDCINDIKESFGRYIRETQINELPCNPRYTSFNITY